MLTARELLNTHFDQAFRGYNPGQVDTFITRLVGEYETLMQENHALKAAAAQSEVVAVDEAVPSAHRDAVDEQVIKAQEQLSQLEQEIKTAQLELRLIEEEKAALYTKVRTLLQEFTLLLNQSEPESTPEETWVTSQVENDPK